MENSEKLENNDNLNNKKQLKRVRIVKSGYGDEALLKDFYDYLKAKDIQEVFGVEEADLIISLGKRSYFKEYSCTCNKYGLSWLSCRSKTSKCSKNVTRLRKWEL